MSKETTSVAVSDWDERMRKAADAQASQERPDNNWISFKSGVLQLNEQAAKGNKINCIIIDAAYENGLYLKPYDPNKLVSPDCWAISRDGDELAPTHAVPNPVATRCGGCPNNEWGSDPKGGKGKACKNIRRIAIVLESDLDKGAAAPILFARIPTMSVRNWSKYVTQVASVIRRPSWAVVTELSVVPDAKSQFQVHFNFVSNVGDDLLPTIEALTKLSGDSLLADYTANAEA
jgi:hypothetical protein